tara:strand:- start:761 stop:2356 length:1596 start_codon:yes stop_codon:yes gene_type:complete
MKSSIVSINFIPTINNNMINPFSKKRLEEKKAQAQNQNSSIKLVINSPSSKNPTNKASFTPVKIPSSLVNPTKTSSSPPSKIPSSLVTPTKASSSQPSKIPSSLVTPTKASSSQPVLPLSSGPPPVMRHSAFKSSTPQNYTPISSQIASSSSSQKSKSQITVSFPSKTASSTKSSSSKSKSSKTESSSSSSNSKSSKKVGWSTLTTKRELENVLKKMAKKLPKDIKFCGDGSWDIEKMIENSINSIKPDYTSFQRALQLMQMFETIRFVKSIGGELRVQELYHGTNSIVAEKILENGFIVNGRFVYSMGIYLTNNRDEATRYADESLLVPSVQNATNGLKWIKKSGKPPGTNTVVLDENFRSQFTSTPGNYPSKIEFTRKQWESFGLKGITTKHVVLINDNNYYEPVGASPVLISCLVLIINPKMEDNFKHLRVPFVTSNKNSDQIIADILMNKKGYSSIVIVNGNSPEPTAITTDEVCKMIDEANVKIKQQKKTGSQYPLTMTNPNADGTYVYLVCTDPSIVIPVAFYDI